MNKVHFFSNGVEALEYLLSTKERPFLILSDINMPKMNGLDLRTKIDEDETLLMKAIPFIFFTTSTNPSTIAQAFRRGNVQGYFQKSATVEEMKLDMKLILDYWRRSFHAGG